MAHLAHYQLGALELLPQQGAGDDEYVDFEGIAATDDADLADDISLTGGIDWQHFVRHGSFNWDHKNNPEDWVGVPLEIRPNAVFKGVKGVYVKGRLMLKQARAREIINTLRALKAAKTDRRMGLSVQGKVLVRDPLNRRRILRSLVNKISFTPHPVNTNTFVDLLKSLDAEQGIYLDAWRDIVEEYLGDLLGDNTQDVADALFHKALTSE